MSRLLSPREKNFLTKHGFDFQNKNISDTIPVEYLVNKAEFRDLIFEVNENVLIPRIETEQIVDLCLEQIDKHFTQKEVITIADVCTGSGCIGISLASELVKKKKNFHIYFSDFSPSALKLAQKNYQLILPEYQSNATFLVSDMLSDYPPINLDIILSNPPYIPTKNINKLDNSVKNHEPLLALDGGAEGVDLINKLISELPKYQTKINAFIEVDDTYKLSKSKKSEGFNPSLIKDVFGANRFLSLFLL